MKTLLEQLHAVSEERGFQDFRHCTDDGLIYVVEYIIKTAGKRYALEACKESLKNSNFRFEKHYYLDNVDMPFEKHKIRELITDEENIPKEVKP